MKKVLVLTVIAILALGVMALADMTHVAGTAGGASYSRTINATINVYQWFDYEISGPSAPFVISDDSGNYEFEVVTARVSSNATLDVTYTVSGNVPENGSWHIGSESGPGFTGGTPFKVSAASKDDPANISLWYVNDDVKYKQAAGTYSFTVALEIAATVDEF